MIPTQAKTAPNHRIAESTSRAANCALILVHDKEKSREKWNKVVFYFSRNRGSNEICHLRTSATRVN
jgi:hypothetical protein